MPRVKKEEQKVSVKPKVVKTATKKSAGLSIPVYSLAGASAGEMELPKEIFGQKVNQHLLSQAVRVYMTNSKEFTASTKTRGEVMGSTAKIFRQKGTGRARHGSIMAPIFVGGGIVFGPKPRKVRLDLPKKMKKASLVSAFSSKAEEKSIFGLSGVEKATGKTKQMSSFLDKVFDGKKKTVLILTGEKNDNIVRASRNISGVDVLPANLINTYELLKHEVLLLTKDALEKLNLGKGVKS
ncbi:50S ribosomal protein L4 [Candidatus Daviesbacteria bacterium]|nr:50S ribosomal protein L4 [Candidatus Daviesbacteria bacterium]